MLFISLIMYIAILVPYRLAFAHFLPSVQAWPDVIEAVCIYVIALLISWLAFFLISSFDPIRRNHLREVIRTLGIKWIAFVTWVSILAIIVIVSVKFNSNSLLLSILVPGLVISFMNSMGLDFGAGILQEDMPPPKIVEPPEMTVMPEQEGIVKQYSWSFEEKSYGLELSIRRSIYDSYHNKKRVPYQEWAREYIARGLSDEVRELAHKLLRIGHSYGTYQEVALVLSFVQKVISYETEEEEYPKYPVETLVDGKGDCEDFSILGASLLKTMGYEVALLFLPGHAALGVAGADGLDGTFIEQGEYRYYYCEMTAAGWALGQMPEEYKKSEIEVHPVPGIRVDSDQYAAEI